jgi:pyruvate-ferredoxin/flavodoxin oxidoreductase
MPRKTKTMDGNTAAAHVAYAFTEVAAIFPITPSSVMAELVDEWSANGRENIFGQRVSVLEMQSEGGAAGAVHGSIVTGALTSTFTASQGLLLMIPNMYKIAGEGLPGVIHVSARALASHALSIFGDHSDVMSCRQTGYAMLCAANPQEVMDLGAVAHLATIKGEVPFLHFFDGFRTSHEMRKVELWDYADLADMLDRDALAKFRARANLPAHPVLRGSAQNPDIFFQNREASNTLYLKLPEIVEEYMNEVNRRLGTNYKPFNYYGAKDATEIIIAMGSICDVAEEVVDTLNTNGKKVGLISVHLYRPFSVEHLLKVLPETVKNIAVLDRTKEPGALGEPLYLDIVTALNGSGIKIVGGRYGLGSKDTQPEHIASVFDNLFSANPKNGFTVAIEDDVTHLSLPVNKNFSVPTTAIACKFWGIGSDGTVGANKNSIKIIGDNTDLNAQAYFQYDSKKSGGVTISHLRFGKDAIKSSYYITKANFVACHAPTYMEMYDIVQDIMPGGTFLLNCPWEENEIAEHIPAAAKKYLADNNIKFYTVDAIHLAREIGLGGRTNTILQAAFFKISNILPIDAADKAMRKAIVDSYGSKGEKIVNMNMAAVDAGLQNIKEFKIPADWTNPADIGSGLTVETDRADLKNYVEKIMIPANAMRGDALPVSTFLETKDGALPQGTAAFERRGVAVSVPAWKPENCIQCGQCALVCPHASIRTFAYSADEAAAAPKCTKFSAKMTGKGCEDYKFSVAVSPLDCLGCNSCANVCPAKEKALVMEPIETQTEQQAAFDYAVNTVTEKKLPFAAASVKGSQLKTPLFEFSGACAGCGETPYAKLITQLYGDRMHIANATGCSSIWGGSAPSTPYTVNKQGRGPAWSNSLFEDNAEFGLGMLYAGKQRRAKLIQLVEAYVKREHYNPDLKAAMDAWLAAKDDAEASKAASKELEEKLIWATTFTDEERDGFKAHAPEYFEKVWNKELDRCDCEVCEEAREILEMSDLFVKPSFWCFGGDGWAYDIGYGGLDHVIASGENINIFVFDTEVYSNTGGQSSKATPTGAVAQFAAAGKATKKKDLAAIAMQYGYVYVAQIALGADYNQTIKAIAEAEAYDGPSLIIAYAPCINHGNKNGMGKSISTQKEAVQSGYWHLFRYDPETDKFILDSKEPTEPYRSYIMKETRYSSLTLTFPERAEKLFQIAEENAKAKYERLANKAD